MTINLNVKFLYQQTLFILRNRFLKKWSCCFRRCYYRRQGMIIGKETNVSKLYITWPHQVSIGNNCNLEHNVYFKYDGIWSKGPSIIIDDKVFIGANCEFNCNCKILIGKYSNIASGCKFIDHDHGFEIGKLIGPQPSFKSPIVLGIDVWLGCNVVVLKGVTIGNGSVVGAGSVVTKSIPENEIWAGVPAKKIRERS